MPIRMNEADRVRYAKRAEVIIADVKYYSGLVCAYCLEEISGAPHIDHIQSRATGGHSKEFDNLITCCASCNGRKCATDVKEIFGEEVAQRVELQIKSRMLTEDDKEAAIDIFYSVGNWQDRIELIFDWAFWGFRPIRIKG